MPAGLFPISSRLPSPASRLPARSGAVYSPAMERGADSSDEDLMLLYRDGDAGAFDALYARHKGGLYRYFLRQCRDAAAAEEMFQDVWMNLVRARKSYTVQAKFTTYFYRLAHNRLMDHYRRNQSRPAALSFEDAGDETILEVPDERERPADDALDHKRQAARLLELISDLPEAQREAFLLQQEGGMSVEAIAEATGVSRETAKSRLRYAMAKLRHGMRA